MSIAEIEAVGLWIVMPLCVALVGAIIIIVYGGKE